LLEGCLEVDRRLAPEGMKGIANNRPIARAGGRRRNRQSSVAEQFGYFHQIVDQANPDPGDRTDDDREARGRNDGGCEFWSAAEMA
jgi:hypothetical protein